MLSEYGVIEGNILQDTIDEINKWINEGWQPQGGLSVYHEHKDYEDVQGKTVFFQSMVRLNIKNKIPEIKSPFLDRFPNTVLL